MKCPAAAQKVFLVLVRQPTIKDIRAMQAKMPKSMNVLAIKLIAFSPYSDNGIILCQSEDVDVAFRQFLNAPRDDRMYDHIR